MSLTREGGGGASVFRVRDTLAPRIRPKIHTCSWASRQNRRKKEKNRGRARGHKRYDQRNDKQNGMAHTHWASGSIKIPIVRFLFPWASVFFIRLPGERGLCVSRNVSACLSSGDLPFALVWLELFGASVFRSCDLVRFGVFIFNSFTQANGLDSWWSNGYKISCARVD